MAGGLPTGYQVSNGVDIGTVASQSAGTTITTTGTANTKQAWVQLASSTAYDADFADVAISLPTNAFTNYALVDIGVGAGSYFVVQKALGAGTGPTGSTTYTFSFNAVGSGNAVMGVVMYSPSTEPTSGQLPTSIKDNIGNSYTVEQNYNSSSTSNQALVFQGVNITGGPTSITVTWPSNAQGVRASMIEVSGIASFDTSASNNGTASTYPISISSGNITPAVSGEFLYGVMVDMNGGDNDTYTAGTNFTLQNEILGSAGNNFADETYGPYNSTSAIAATGTMGISTGSSSVVWFSAIMAFKPSATGAQQVILSNLTHVRNSSTPISHYQFPCSIAAGSSVWARVQVDTNASTDKIFVSAILFQTPIGTAYAGSVVDTYGIQTTSSPYTTQITLPTTDNTMSAWTSIATLSYDALGFSLHLDFGGGNSYNGPLWFGLLNVGIGASGSQVPLVSNIPFLACSPTNGVPGIIPNVLGYYPGPVPSGTRFWVQAQVKDYFASGATPRVLGVSLHGVRG